jgi:hypothetical protein
MNTACRHGFDPAVGPGLWCPACDAEKRVEESLPLLLRLAWRYRAWAPAASAVGLLLSLASIVMALGVLLRWW